VNPLHHPELRAAARFLPRGVGKPWAIKLMKLLPFPTTTPPNGITVTEHALAGSVSALRTSGSAQRAPSGGREGRPSTGGAARIRVIAPSTTSAGRAAIVWIHGGGYVIGSAKQDDPTCIRFAKRLDAVVVNVDYRLAPEHPFPAPLDDCYAAFEWLHENAASLGVDPSRVVIAGQSAGGGLAAALVLRAHDVARWPRPMLQVLVYPMLDDRTALRTDVDERQFRLWNNASNRVGWRAYLGREPGADDVTDHAAPARRVDLSRLPPAWIGVGTHDLFHDENVKYAERLRAAGVAVQLDIIDGVFHGFDALFPKKAVSRRFFDAQVDAIRKLLAP